MVSRTHKTRGMCAVPTCQEPAECGEYCSRHYNRSLYRKKADLPTGDLPDGWPCPICGERLRQLSNHMKRHHGIALSEWYRQNDVSCRWPDCDCMAVKRGLCNRHYKLELKERHENV